MALSYQGPVRLKIGGRNPFQHTPNVRLVMRGSILMTALLVRKDTSMKTIHDIRGKRLTGDIERSPPIGTTSTDFSPAPG